MEIVLNIARTPRQKGLQGWSYLGHKVAFSVLGDKRGDTTFKALKFPTRFYYWSNPWFVLLVVRWYDRVDKRSAG